ncbi:hypothetical protein PR202_ga25626 [Eleusine coracana subsp. coracana]|uniref:Uncharacterized protein n=1 Tax=Eleusine coracana subsp. coracana TaxID=191504 RepID=A0AAV5DBT7_ELECO|nr:hypothetical protein PR202_ga25626 [Eleusine coracana subsp. coracana]
MLAYHLVFALAVLFIPPNHLHPQCDRHLLPTLPLLPPLPPRCRLCLPRDPHLHLCALASRQRRLRARASLRHRHHGQEQATAPGPHRHDLHARRLLLLLRPMRHRVVCSSRPPLSRRGGGGGSLGLELSSRLLVGAVLVCILACIHLLGLLVGSKKYYACKAFHNQQIDRMAPYEYLGGYLGEYVPLNSNIQMENLELGA